VPKYHPRMHALGTIDELNCAVGMAASFANPAVRKILHKVQHQLFSAQAQLGKGAVAIELPAIEQRHVDALEEVIAQFERKLSAQKRFILPGGSKAASHLHFARAVCRRAERVAFQSGEKGMIIKYLNRLSSLLFVLARASNKNDVEVAYD